MKQAGKLYLERFLRPQLAEVDPRLTDPRISTLDRARIAAGALDQSADDPQVLYQLLHVIRLASAANDFSDFARFFAMAQELRFVPRLSLYLSHVDPRIQDEAVWFYSNMTSRSSASCDALQECVVISKIIDCFAATEDLDVRIGCTLAVLNFAGNSEERATFVMESSFPRQFIGMLKRQRTAFLARREVREVCWAMGNLFQEKLDKLCMPDRKALVDFIVFCLSAQNDPVVRSKLGVMLLIIMHSILERDPELRTYAISVLDFPAFLGMLDAKTEELRRFAVQLVGTFALGDDEDTKRLVSAGVLEKLMGMMRSEVSSTIACYLPWALSNFAAGPIAQRQILVQNGIVKGLTDLLGKCADSSVVGEIDFLVANLLQAESKQLIQRMVEDGMLDLAERLLKIERNLDPMSIIALLDGIKEMAAMCDETTKKLTVEKCMDRIRELSAHPERGIRVAADNLLDALLR